jgi:hypothetical protein
MFVGSVCPAELFQDFNFPTKPFQVGGVEFLDSEISGLLLVVLVR